MSDADQNARVFKTTWFAKAARKARTFAKGYATLRKEQIAQLLQDEDLKEICHGNEN